MNDGFTTGIVGAVVFIVILALFRSIMNRAMVEAFRAQMPEFPVSFRLARWIRNSYILVLSISVLSIVLVNVYDIFDVNVRHVFFFLPGLFIILTGLGLVVDGRKKVIMDKEYVEYRNVTGAFRIPWSKIKDVYTANGLIIIDVGKKTRKVIPMMFQGNGVILRILKDTKRGNAHQKIETI